VTDPSSLRVADADREQLAAELREHLVAGRLTPDEFEERVERAYRASTRAELDALKSDLPLSPASVEAALARRRARLRRHLWQEGGAAVGVSALCVAIWAASGATASFWPIWVIIATMLPLVRDAWRLLGPAPDLEAVEAHIDAGRARRLAARHRELPR
jgi:Domain of unknown function (DUF1707)